MTLRDISQAAADYFTGITARDILGPLAGIVVGLAGSRATRHQTARSEHERTEAAQVAASAAHHAADAATAENLTRRFQALMDGYERRIASLTDEVQSLREEVAKLRRELERGHA